MNARHGPSALFLLSLSVVALLATGRTAVAAESYDNCTGTIASLPAVLSSQGVWCMKGDLSTASTVGNAITVTTNNVTIDCNGFKLGGLAAGTGTTAIGILADDRFNVTVRHCSLRGFAVGIGITGTGGGHVIEDNRFDAIRFIGMTVEGDGSTIRRNRLLDTGGSTLVFPQFRGIAMFGSGEIIDNSVRIVDASSQPDADVIGIYLANAQGGSIRDNHVSGLVQGAGAGDEAMGIAVASSAGVAIRDNDLSAVDGHSGIRCAGGAGDDVVAIGNMIHRFATPILVCADGGGNWTSPP